MSRDWLNLTWREKTWSERAQTVACNIFAFSFGLAMLFGILLVLGQIIDTQDQYRAERRHCLKDATNGLEIEQCR